MPRKRRKRIATDVLPIYLIRESSEGLTVSVTRAGLLIDFDKMKLKDLLTRAGCILKIINL